MIWIGLLFCAPMSGKERDDIQFVSRKLKQIAEQLPEGTLSSVDTIMEIPVIIEGKSIVMQHNDKGQVCHLGVSLFSEATKQILDVGLCNFLERFFLELLLQKDAVSIDRKLQEYHVVMYVDGQKVVVKNAKSFQRVLEKMNMPVNFSMRQKGKEAEAVWL